MTAVLVNISKSLRSHFQALDALGTTKWNLNNVVLDVLEEMWAGGGRLADLVDQEQPSSLFSIIVISWQM